MNKLNSFLEENSALVDKKALYDMYQQAVNFALSSFFYIDTNAKDVSHMFFRNFQQRFEIGDNSEYLFNHITNHQTKFKLQQLNGIHFPLFHWLLVFNSSTSFSNTSSLSIMFCNELNVIDSFVTLENCSSSS